MSFIEQNRNLRFEHALGRSFLVLLVLMGLFAGMDLIALITLKVSGRGVLLRNRDWHAWQRRKMNLPGSRLVFTPYRVWRPQYQGALPIRTNRPELGPWRETVGRESPCSSPVRVWVFGASPIYAGEHRAANTIPSLLEKLLNQQGCYQVFNFGVPGYVIKQELLLFADLLKSGKEPDFALFYDGSTDASVASGGISEVETHFWMKDLKKEMVRSRETAMEAAVQLGDLLLGELPTFQLYRRVRAYFTGNSPVNPFQSNQEIPLAKLAVERYEETASLIHRLGQAYGVKTLVLWQPDRVAMEQESSDKRRRTKKIHRWAKVRAERSRAFEYIGNLLSDEDELFSHGPHLTKKGNLIVARWMYRRLAELSSQPLNRMFLKTS